MSLKESRGEQETHDATCRIKMALEVSEKRDSTPQESMAWRTSLKK